MNGQMDANTLMKQFADNMAKYAKKTKTEPEMGNVVRMFRARIISVNVQDGIIDVQRPFDETVMSLPCIGSYRYSADVGDECVVMYFGSLSNAIVIGDGSLSNL